MFVVENKSIGLTKPYFPETVSEILFREKMQGETGPMRSASQL